MAIRDAIAAEIFVRHSMGHDLGAANMVKYCFNLADDFMREWWARQEKEKGKLPPKAEVVPINEPSAEELAKAFGPK